MVLFVQQSGSENKPIDLHAYWFNLRRSFYQFYWNYTGEGSEKYFESLGTKVQILKMYFE